MRWAATAIVVAAFPALLRAELLPIKTYTTADGLASDCITRIVVDSRGFLWFGTPEGLSRFDGTHFVNYGTDDGLPGRAVAAVHEARSGDLWVATLRGLGRIAANSHAARFTTLSLAPENGAASVLALAESRSGGMWAATKTGLFAWTDPLRIRRHDVPLPAPERITDLTEDAAGRLWVGTTTGIVVLGRDGGLRRFTMNEGLPGNWVEMFALDSRSQVWAALRGGLAQFGPGADGEPVLETVYTNALAGTDVKAVTEASDGTVWVGTTQGISRLRWERGGRASIERLTRAQGLSDRSIQALAEDQAGNMWVGTESAGAMRIGSLGFTTFREQDGLGSDRVWSVLEGRAGELLAVTLAREGAPARSVNVYDGTRFHVLVPRVFAERAWGANQILLQGRSGDWWAATRRGLCRFDAVKAADLDRRSPRRCYDTGSTIFGLFEASRGGVWASAQSPPGDRLMRWSPETDAVFQFEDPGIPAKPRQARRDDLVSAFAEDRQGNVWMGLYKGGLYRYDGRELRHFEQHDGVPRGAVLALLATGSGLWIGSDGGGLGRIERTEDLHPHVEVYDTARGMSSDIVPCLVEDRAGHLYAGTARGVDRLDPKSGHIRHFSAADGFVHGACHGAFRDRFGSLWFATTQGLSRFVPGDEPKPLKPQVLITAARIGDEPYAVSPLGETRIVLPDLKPSRSQLQAEFVGIDHEPGAVVDYSYKLEGADSKWSVPRNHQSVSYAALASGTYRFLVKAVTSEGTESAAPAEIDFTVLAPAWRRPWFVGLAVAFGIALALAAYRYRVAQMLGLERMRTSIATDLHDDIGASLSQIAILSEVARAGEDRKTTVEPLKRIAILARELVDSMNDIVWSIRSEPHGWDSLVRHMREFALDVLVSQRIDFQLRTPVSGDGMPMSLQVRRQLFLMFKECIHNAARHSRSSEVVAELKAGHREVVLTVEDNGVGWTPGEGASRSAGGNGIPGMQRRAQSLGGRLDLVSTPGHGCRVEIHLPVGRGHRATAAS